MSPSDPPLNRAGAVSPIWHRVVASTPAPAQSIVITTGVVALLLVGIPVAWHYSRHLVTITHEAAHGVVALVSGRRLAGIRLHSDTSGLTLSRGRATGFGMFFTAAAGYVGPGLLGLGAAALLLGGHAVGLLWLALALLALMLIQIRNWFGLWSILATGLVVFGVSWWGSAPVQTAFAYTLTWFLLLCGPRPVIELQRLRGRGQARDSDADIMARLTSVPGIVWVCILFVIAVAELILGGTWLLSSGAS
jgi:hypothetical protein